MTEYLNKSFSVYPGGNGGQKYRDNWDAVFSKKAEVPEKRPCPRCDSVDCPAAKDCPGDIPSTPDP